MRKLRSHLSYANVMSTLALFIALTGASAYAANQLADRSVGAPQLRPGAVTADKLRKNSVTAPKIKSLAVKQGKLANGAVTSAKIAGGAVTGEKLPAGAIGTEKIANDAVTGEKVNEGSLGQVPSANNANFANVAATANPEAFAKVNEEGTVFPGDSKGIGTADVKQGIAFPGIYCIKVPFVPKGAQATPEFNEHPDVSVYVRLGGTSNCPAPQAEVQTYNSGSHEKEPFFIVFYR